VIVRSRELVEEMFKSRRKPITGSQFDIKTCTDTMLTSWRLAGIGIDSGGASECQVDTKFGRRLPLGRMGASTKLRGNKLNFHRDISV